MTTLPKAGRYELQQEIGRGSMGVVYRAHDPVINRTVAVKTVRLPEEGSGMSHHELLERFQTEARAAGLLAHPHIVVVYDAGEEDGVFYITMELVEGRSLQEQIGAGQAFPLPRIMRWMQQACSALDFAHNHSVIHRDIKPANLLITTDDSLKISDFGTAKIQQLGATQTAHVIGTPSYMSPEQIKGKTVDGRSDVFSLGVVLYELLTGAKPFSGDSVTTVIYKIVNEDPIPPREVDSSIHPGLSAIVNRALAKSPWARFQSCHEFAAALADYKNFAEPKANPAASERTISMPASSQQPVNRGIRPAPIDPRVLEEAQKELSRKRGSFWVGVLLILVIAGAGYRVWPAVQEMWRLHQESPAPSAPVATGAADSSSAPAASESSSAPSSPTSAQPAPSPATASTTPAPDSAPAGDSGAADQPAEARAASSAPAAATPAAVSPATRAAGRPAIAGSTPHPTAPAVRSAAPAKPAPQKPGGPAASPVAAQWKLRIERVLVESDVADRVRVSAAANTLTLTGKLDPALHRVLLGNLEPAPAGVQIIDDIEYAEGPADNR